MYACMCVCLCVWAYVVCIALPCQIWTFVILIEYIFTYHPFIHPVRLIDACMKCIPFQQFIDRKLLHSLFLYFGYCRNERNRMILRSREEWCRSRWRLLWNASGFFSWYTFSHRMYRYLIIDIGKFLFYVQRIALKISGRGKGSEIIRK